MESLTTTWTFKLGEKVKDTVTGFKGTVISRVEYLNGCLQYCIDPKVGKEGKMEKSHYVDEGQLVSAETRSARARKSAPGGVMPHAPDRN